MSNKLVAELINVRAKWVAAELMFWTGLVLANIYIKEAPVFAAIVMISWVFVLLHQRNLDKHADLITKTIEEESP